MTAVEYFLEELHKEQTNGERFEEFMKTVEGYPHLAYPELDADS